MKKLIFFSLAAITLLLSSCSKNSNYGSISSGPINYPPFYTSQFDSIAIAYMYLKPNSNYIYKDQITGLTDTVKVTISNRNYGNSYFTEKYDLTCSIISYNLPPSIWLQASASCDENKGPAPVFYDADFELRNLDTQLPAFWYPFTSSLNKQYTYISSIIIEGTTYNGVNKFQVSNGLLSTQMDYLETIFYWVKGIGIIKKEIKTYNSVKTSLLVKYW